MVDLDGLLAAIGLHHSGRTDEHTLLDIGHFCRDDRNKHRIVGDRQFHLGAIAVLDHVNRTFDAFDGAADADGFLWPTPARLMQIKAKLAANMRCIVPDIAIPGFANALRDAICKHQQYPDIPDQKTAANLKSLTHRNRRAPIRS